MKRQRKSSPKITNKAKQDGIKEEEDGLEEGVIDIKTTLVKFEKGDDHNALDDLFPDTQPIDPYESE